MPQGNYFPSRRLKPQPGRIDLLRAFLLDFQDPLAGLNPSVFIAGNIDRREASYSSDGVFPISRRSCILEAVQRSELVKVPVLPMQAAPKHQVQDVLGPTRQKQWWLLVRFAGSQ